MEEKTDILAQRTKHIRPSPTMAITQKAADMRRMGRDVIGLGAGEPDFPTPPHIRAAAIEAMQRGETKYTAVAGTWALRQAIRKKFGKENGLSYDLEEIIVTSGGKQAIFHALLATLDPGEEVLIPAPYWVSYPDMTRLVGGVDKIIPCRKDFKLQPEELENAIAPKSRWLILNTPGNPTGACYSVEEMRRIGEVVERHPRLMILSDEIYEHIRYAEEPHVSFAAACPQLRERTLVVNGVSKAYCMTGWRIGYAVGPKILVKAMSKMQSQSTTCPCAIGQAAAVEALTGPQEFLQAHNRAFQDRRDTTVAALQATRGITCATPPGAFYLYPSCAGAIGRKTPDGRVVRSDADFAAYLLEHARVAVVPGEAFGFSPYFRVSYATSKDVLVEAVRRIRKACEALR